MPVFRYNLYTGLAVVENLKMKSPFNKVVFGWNDLLIQDHDSCFASSHHQMVVKSIGNCPEVAFCGSQMAKF